MAGECNRSLKVCAYRIAELNVSGAVATGADLYTAADIGELLVSPEIRTGLELEERNGCDNVCNFFQDADQTRWLNLTLNLCHAPPGVYQMLLGATSLDGGEGFQLPALNAASPLVAGGTALEIWTQRRSGGGVADATNPYFRWLFPLVKWALGDRTFNASWLQHSFTGRAYENAGFTTGGATIAWPADSSKVLQVVSEAALPTVSATCLLAASA